MTDTLNRDARRALLRHFQDHIRKERPRHGECMAEQSIPDVMRERHPNPPFRVWRSRDFLAQAYEDQGFTRLSVQRVGVSDVTHDGGPVWEEGITWDDLMRVKSECGFADEWAAEVYPPDTAVVNVANIRHLWILAERPAFSWCRG